MRNCLPDDSFLCLSIVNTKLRDFYRDLNTLCEDMEIDKEQLIEKMASIDYVYDVNQNQFV